MIKPRVGVLTATRAEFGLLKPLIQRLRQDTFFETRVLVTGTHLSPAFGNTIREIEEAGIPIAEKIDILTAGDTPQDISKNMARALEGFAACFAAHRIDLLVVLGDRYETLAVCIAAMNERIPIAHIHGGEATEGLIDEAIRHSITKMSQLHFVCAEIYRRRVIQLGEEPDRVFNVGALSVENIRRTEFLSRRELGEELGLNLDRPYAVVTFHPVTLAGDSGISQLEALLDALDEFPGLSYIITKANADTGGRTINSRIDAYAEARDNVVSVASLGVRRYLSAVRESVAVIGNSSSGVIEVPCLHKPTVNIGDRQRGRFMPASVINCAPERDAIVDAVRRAMDPVFLLDIEAAPNPFGNGDTSELITAVLKEQFRKKGGIGVMKRFYDIGGCG